MRKAATTIGLVLALAVIGTGRTPQSAADLYQKALTMEKAEGNLEEAIALYQKVVDKGDDEALAAQAQLHIGLCYEKLGLSKAREAYQRVIDRFPRQVEVVKTARDKLALLTAARTDKPGASGEINIRRVYDDYGPEWGNALSSDGRYLVYTDWSTGDMAVVDLVTKQHRRITDTGGQNSTTGEFGETSAFSPDDRRVAYGWRGGDRVNELRVINFDGTEPRVLLRDENTVWIRPHAWSADGKSILLALMRKDETCDIAMLSLPGNKISIVRKMAAKGPEMALSPDGTVIAYSIAPEAGSSKRDVFIMKTDGTGHETLIAHPADDYLLGWSPDGRRVVFASDRSGTFGIWAIEVANGRAQGTALWLKSDLTPDPVRLTPDGTLYYIHMESLFDVFSVPIEPGTGKSLGAPTAVKSQRTGIRTGPDWSPDGKRLAYKYFAGNEARTLGRAQICVFDF
ncbi:MAG: tetratricopeptide repeat protein, partial [Candidatus Aminicenantes bacterium]|nr:tetratricopeptide repeat protein [Candidatus Aminicenantes bacterium]